MKDAVIEQKTLGLDWFTRTESVIRIRKYKESVDASSKAEVMTSKLLGKSVISKMQNKFVELWNIERRKNRKLEFYNLIKSQYKEEDYQKLTQKHYEQARSIAKSITSKRAVLPKFGCPRIPSTSKQRDKKVPQGT